MSARIRATASSFHQLSPSFERSSAAGKWICGTSWIAAYTPTALMSTLISRSATGALPRSPASPAEPMLPQQEPRSERIRRVERELVGAGPEGRAAHLRDD